MQIEIDFEVFKALTALRQTEADSYNLVIRRLLKLPNHAEEKEAGMFLDYLLAENQKPLKNKGFFDRLREGAWFNGVNFPEGTKFRATYKGQTYHATVKGSKWVGLDGAVRSSPSDAANAITGTNVNGWRFWYAQRPDDSEWKRLDKLKALQ